jgi:DNA repair protein SbcD/Mre11
LKLLCAADLHIGRRPRGLPRPWSDGRISAARAWDGLVDAAIQHEVDAVLLAGDVVDQENRFFEAFGPLGAGVRRLESAGIAVVAVAGNHDHESLHAVADQVGGGHLRVLGRGGEWERWTLTDDHGRARLHVDGWSFPSSHHAGDPTRDYPFSPPDDGAPVVGLLHADVDSADTRYAPVPRASLGRLPVAAWVLGHVHVPSLREAPGSPPILYPGSLLALDAGETGRRGGWLVELSPGRAPSFRPLPLSRLRYEAVSIDVTEWPDPGALPGQVASALAAHLEAVVAEGVGPLELVSCRVRLVGRTPLHTRLGQLLSELDELSPEAGGVRLVVERLGVETRPALDLDDLARGVDAPGVLARLVRELDGDPTGDSPDAQLVERAERAVRAVAGRGHYGALEGGGGEPPEARGALRRQAMKLLDELVRQKEAV